jgi:hypothetical protein
MVNDLLHAPPDDSPERPKWIISRFLLYFFVSKVRSTFQSTMASTIELDGTYKANLEHGYLVGPTAACDPQRPSPSRAIAMKHKRMQCNAVGSSSAADDGAVRQAKKQVAGGAAAGNGAAATNASTAPTNASTAATSVSGAAASVSAAVRVLHPAILCLGTDPRDELQTAGIAPRYHITKASMPLCTLRSIGQLHGHNTTELRGICINDKKFGAELRYLKNTQALAPGEILRLPLARPALDKVLGIWGYFDFEDGGLQVPFRLTEYCDGMIKMFVHTTDPKRKLFVCRRLF